MEHNEITARVDVKMDLKERRSEFAVYRNWTRTTLRIEAIKCFPCYVKVTFVHQLPAPHMPTVCANSVININLPGLTVNLATSRTKEHTYGLFWKNNRNRCCMYLAFADAEQCARHHHWMQQSIRNLDLHRREIHETRRASRYSSSVGRPSMASMASSGFGAASRCNDTGYIADLNELLGPLPALPDSAVHWSRRISGVSGIYEEIEDRGGAGGGAMSSAEASMVMQSPQSPLSARAASARKVSRASVASGIYEIMRPPMESIRESIPPSPPPLPPRSRTFTNQEVEFKRSYTNPDADTFKPPSAPLAATMPRHGVHGILHQLHMRQNSGGGLVKTATSSSADGLNDTLKALSLSSPDLSKLSPGGTRRRTSQPGAKPDTTTSTTTLPPPASRTAAAPKSNTLRLRSADLLPLAQSMQNLCTSPLVLTPNGRIVSAAQTSASLAATAGAATTPLRNHFVFDDATTLATSMRPHTMPNTPLSPSSTNSVLGLQQLIDCPSGYCAMAPIVVSASQTDVNKPQTPLKSPPQADAHQPLQTVLDQTTGDENLYMSLDSSRLRVVSADCVDGDGDGPTTPISTELPVQLRRSGSSDAENQHHISKRAALSAIEAAYKSSDALCAAAAATFKSPLRSSSTNHHNVVHHHTPGAMYRNITERSTFTTPSSTASSMRLRNGAVTEPRLHAHRPPTMRPLSIDDKVPSYFPNMTPPPPPSMAYVNSDRRHPPAAKSSKKSLAHQLQMCQTQQSERNGAVKSVYRSRSQEQKTTIATTTTTTSKTSDKFPPNSNISTKKPTAAAAADTAVTDSKRSRFRHKKPSKDAVAAVALHATNSSPLPMAANQFGDENSAQEAMAGGGVVVAAAATTVEKSSSKVAELGSSIKRFASLPRFRKLNFSPLKFKFNSVLQR